jgi:hypothetical protein
MRPDARSMRMIVERMETIRKLKRAGKSPDESSAA